MLSNKMNIVLLSLVLILAIVFCIWVFKSKWSNTDTQLDHSPKNSQENNLELIQKLKSNHSQRFAGAFIDSENKLNINLVEGTNPQSLNLKDDVNIIIRYVKYSYYELEEVYAKVSKIRHDDITSIELNERENKVFIYLKRKNELLKKEIQKKAKSSSIEIVYSDLFISH